MSLEERTEGALVNGTQLSPVELLIYNLNGRFASLQEEVQMAVANDFFNFHRHGSEDIDSLIARFEMMRYRGGKLMLCKS